jgi:hypothetical protein
MKFLYCFFCFVFLASCQMEKGEGESSSKSVSVAMDEILKLEQKQAATEANSIDLKVVNSLAYTGPNDSRVEVFAYLDVNNAIVKIEEGFFDKKSNNIGTKFFYLENGKKYMTRELFVGNEKFNGDFVERQSFYGQNGEVLYTKTRQTLYEENIDRADFASNEKYDCKMDRAMQVLNQEGPFSTTFQGFLEDGPLTYIVVGGDGKEGYISALAVQFFDDQLGILKNAKKELIGTPLKVDFEKMINNQNFEYQVLLRAQISGVKD